MSPVRTWIARWWLAGAVATVVAGCGGHEARPVAIGSRGAGAERGEEPGATAVAPPGGLRRALAAMPADYKLVFGLDATRLRASALYRAYESKVREAFGDALADVQRECGFDPLTSVTGLVVGIRGLEGESHNTVFVNGLEREATNRCLARRSEAARRTKPSVRFVVDGDFVEYAEDDPEDGLRLQWIGRRSLLTVAAGDESAGPRVLAAAAAAREGAGLTGSGAFVSQLARTRTDAGAWFIARGDLVPPGLLPTPIRAMRAALDADEGVRGTIAFTMDDANAARDLTLLLQGQLDQLRQSIFSSQLRDVAVRADGADVVVDLAFSLEQLEQLGILAGGVVP